MKRLDGNGLVMNRLGDVSLMERLDMFHFMFF